jgi:hypothetical protein
LDTPIIPTIPEIGYEDKVSSGSGVNISAIIESHYDVKVSYVVNRIIIP